MTLKDALNILGLKENCTEEDLKKAYRTLAKVYHPDNYQDETKRVEASKKMKILNEANAIVKANIQQKDNIKLGNNNNPDLKSLKNKYEIEVLKELKYIVKLSEKELNIVVISYYEKFRKLIYNDFNQKLKYINNIETLKQEYGNYRRKYINLLYLYNDYIASKLGFNMVDLANYTSIPMNKEITLEFYRDRVLEIVNYNLNIELDKYKNIEDYDVLEYLLNAIRETHARTCLWGQKSLGNAKKELNEHINMTITKYCERKKLLNELIISEVDKDIIDNLQKNILSEKEFYAIYNKINKPSKAKTLAKRIIKYFKQKAQLQK